MSKVVKAITKPVKKVVKSVVSAGTDAVSSLVKGDLGGVADAAVRGATMGTISLGDKGIVNANLTNQPKLPTATTPTQQQETEGLLNYVSDLRTRKARRNRASTVNTSGSTSSDANKLSGTTALGV